HADRARRVVVVCPTGVCGSGGRGGTGRGRRRASAARPPDRVGRSSAHASASFGFEHSAGTRRGGDLPRAAYALFARIAGGHAAGGALGRVRSGMVNVSPTA